MTMKIKRYEVMKPFQLKSYTGNSHDFKVGDIIAIKVGWLRVKVHIAGVGYLVITKPTLAEMLASPKTLKEK